MIIFFHIVENFHAMKIFHSPYRDAAKENWLRAGLLIENTDWNKNRKFTDSIEYFTVDNDPYNIPTPHRVFILVVCLMTIIRMFWIIRIFLRIYFQRLFFLFEKNCVTLY